MADTATKPTADNPPSALSRLWGWIGGWARSSVPLAPLPATTSRPTRDAVVAPLDRATIGQWLWGKGFVSPGDEQYILEMVKPFGLNPAMSMLDLSAGLGGPARVIAKAFDTYVTGLERSPERAARGMAMSVEANLAKRAPISQYNPETLELRPNSFDCILGRGATYSIVEKERLFRVVYQGLKQRGQLLFNEFTVDRALADRPELAAWMARESFPPALWSIEQYQDCLTSLGFDIRVVVDVTALYRSMIIAGWASMLKEVNLKAMARSHLITVINEAELWMLRIAALQSGALRVYRVHAILNKPSR
jgi:cyclopropane fatty-acyl-phospholipid synthase-like methyltransferase